MAKHVRDDAHLVVTVRADPANAENQIAALTKGIGNTLGATASVVVTLPGRILDVTFGN